MPNYDDDVDFEALAIQDADFAELYYAADGKLDFQDPKAVQYVGTSTDDEIVVKRGATGN